MFFPAFRNYCLYLVPTFCFLPSATQFLISSRCMFRWSSFLPLTSNRYWTFIVCRSLLILSALDAAADEKRKWSEKVMRSVTIIFWMVHCFLHWRRSRTALVREKREKSRWKLLLLISLSVKIVNLDAVAACTKKFHYNRPGLAPTECNFIPDRATMNPAQMKRIKLQHKHCTIHFD